MRQSVLPVKILLLSCLGLSLSAFADTKKCEFRFGCVGRLYIGQSSASLERLVGRSLKFQFAGTDEVGNDKDGAFIVAEEELAKLHLSQQIGTKIKGVDLIVKAKTIKPYKAALIRIGVGISCDQVDKLRMQAVKDGFEIKEIPAAQGWRAFNSKYTWGAGKFPVCNFFMDALPPGFKW
jgi:hypothetical protein